MPHIILEYSNNLSEKESLLPFFKEVHSYLALHLPTELTACKSRAQERTNFLVGEDAKGAFIHLTVKVKQGRSSEMLNQIGESIMNKLKTMVTTLNQRQLVQLSLEIIELSPHYFKGVSSV